MEVQNVKNVKNDTSFNTNIAKQWIPYWNGMLHLVGNLDDGVIVRRYDWDRIIEECREFEAKYMNTTDFCSTCVFSQIPAWLESRLQQKPSGMSCKEFAQDNDIVYNYCVEKTESHVQILGTTAIVLMTIAAIAVLSVIVYYFLRVQK